MVHGIVVDKVAQKMNSIGLPRFSGASDSFERFVEDFDIFARLQQWNDDQKRDIFPLCLTGIARDAYDALTSEQKNSFEQTVSGIRPSFSGRSSIDCHMLLTTLKYDPNDPLDAFVIHLRGLVSQAFPGQTQDGLLFNHFLMSLPDDYRAQVVADGITTFDAAVKKVRNLTSAFRMKTAGVRQLSANPDVVAQLQRRVEELERQLEARGPSGAAAASSPPTADRTTEAGRRRLCFACGQPGHIRSVCRHRAAVCRKCNERGHLARVCHARPSGQEN